MQIHEITARKLNEISLAGGFAGALANKFVSSTLGVDARDTPSDDPLARSKGAMEINKQLAGKMGQELNKMWGQVVQNFMATHKDTSGYPLNNIKSAAPADAAKLSQELDKIVVDMSRVGKALDQWAAGINTGDPKDAAEARVMVGQLKDIKDAIWKETLDPSDTSGQARAQAFAKLGTAIAQIQNINSFVEQSKKSGAAPGTPRVTTDPRTNAFMVDRQPYDPKNPVHVTAVKDFINSKK
jgi:hypothetical protein